MTRFWRFDAAVSNFIIWLAVFRSVKSSFSFQLYLS